MHSHLSLLQLRVPPVLHAAATAATALQLHCDDLGSSRSPLPHHSNPADG